MPLVVLGVIAMIAGAITDHWWGGHERTSSIELGLREVRTCMFEGCRSVRYEELLNKDSTMFVMLANICFFGAFALAALSLVSISTSFGQPRVSFSRIASAVGAFLVLAAVALLATQHVSPGHIAVSFSALLYIGGAIVTTLGNTMVVTISPTGAVPFAGDAVPVCPTCDGPTVFVAEHSRYRCNHCRIYVGAPN